MFLPKLIGVLAFVELAAAVPKPPCNNETGCTATAITPAPANLRCGVAGQAHFVAGVVIADVTKQGSTSSECALACLENDQCRSIAFDPNNQRCLSFRETPAEMGFIPDEIGGFQFWHHACWIKHCSSTAPCSSPAPTAAAT